MANLLTSETQRIRKHLFVAKLLYTVSATTLLAAVLVALAFLPGYIKARAALDVAQLGVDAAAQRGKSDRDALIRARKRITALESIFSYTRPVDIFAEVLRQAPTGVSVSGINYVTKADSTTLSVVGTTPRRQVVQDFIARLRNTGMFKSVEVPLNSLSRTEDNFFEVRIELPLPL